MLKHCLSFVFVFALLNAGLLFAQEEAAPAAVAESTPAASAEGTSKEVDFSKISFEELVTYMESLEAEAFAKVVDSAVNSGDRYVARRVITAANRVIASADAEKAANLIAAVNALGNESISTQDNVIVVAGTAEAESKLEQKFDAAERVETSIELPKYVEPASAEPAI